MKILVYGVLFVIAAAMVIGLVIGVTFKLIGLLFMALIVVAAVTFTMNKVRGARHRRALDAPAQTERLRR